MQTHILNKREEEIMHILWNSDAPLGIGDITGLSDNPKLKTSYCATINRLIDLGYVEVAEITKIGKSYGRKFKAKISMDDYTKMYFNRLYKKSSLPSFLYSALAGTFDNSDEILEELEKIKQKVTQKGE